MKVKNLIFIAYLSIGIPSVLPAQSAAPDQGSGPVGERRPDSLTRDQRMEWWREARFGMFIHWGVYAQLAGVYEGREQARGGAEWIMNRMKIPVANYQAFAKQF